MELSQVWNDDFIRQLAFDAPFMAAQADKASVCSSRSLRA
jgi:hypothetical protein